MNLLPVYALVPALGSPERSYPIIAAFVFVLILLTVLYFTTTILNKRWLARVIFLIVGLFCVTVVYLFLANRPRAQKPPVAILPFYSADSSPELLWPAWAIPKLASEMLSGTLVDAYNVCAFQSVIDAVPPDSLDSFDCVASFAQRAGIFLIVFGTVEHSGDSWTAKWRAWDSHAIDIPVEASHTFKESEVPDAAWKVYSTVSRLLRKVPDLDAGSGYHDSQLLRRLTLSEIYVNEGKLDEALEVIGQATSTRAMLQQAKIHLARGKSNRHDGFPSEEDFQASRFSARRALALDSTLVDAHTVLAEVAILREEWNRASQELHTAFLLNPSHAKTLVLLAQLHPTRYRDLGFRNEVDLYRRAITCDPCCFEARLALAAYYLNLGESTKALKVIEELLLLNPQSIDGLMAYGRVLSGRGEMSEARSAFESVLKLDPGNAEALYSLGIVAYNSKDYQSARRRFEEAIESSNHLDSYLYLGLIAREIGETDLAIEFFRERVRRKRGPDDKYAESARQNLYELTHPEESPKQ